MHCGGFGSVMVVLGVTHGSGFGSVIHVTQGSAMARVIHGSVIVV